VATDPYQSFDQQLRSCTRCAALLADKAVDPTTGAERVVPRPIVLGIEPRPIMLIGQAPGIREYESGRPFQGQAGQEIRAIFAQLGLHEFDRQVWSTAVVRCYPGRKQVRDRRGRLRVGDEMPTTAMIQNCQPFFQGQFELVRPRIVVTLGSLPLKAYLRLRGRPASEGTLEQFIGRSESWQGRQVIFFPHTSGSSRWLNDPAHRQLFAEAQQQLGGALLAAGLVAQ